MTNLQEIADAFADYYSWLYNLKYDKDMLKALDSLNLLALSNTQLTSLNAPFTEQKIVQMIKTLPSGKSPGPYSFYKWVL